MESMKRLLEYIELEADESATYIAEEVLKTSKQNYYSKKQKFSKDLDMIATLKKKLKLDWSKIGAWIDKDYGNEK